MEPSFLRIVVFAIALGFGPKPLFRFPGPRPAQAPPKHLLQGLPLFPGTHGLLVIFPLAELKQKHPKFLDEKNNCNKLREECLPHPNDGVPVDLDLGLPSLTAIFLVGEVVEPLAQRLVDLNGTRRRLLLALFFRGFLFFWVVLPEQRFGPARYFALAAGYSDPLPQGIGVVFQGLGKSLLKGEPIF